MTYQGIPLTVCPTVFRASESLKYTAVVHMQGLRHKGSSERPSSEKGCKRHPGLIMQRPICLYTPTYLPWLYLPPFSRSCKDKNTPIVLNMEVLVFLG